MSMIMSPFYDPLFLLCWNKYMEGGILNVVQELLS